MRRISLLLVLFLLSVSLFATTYYVDFTGGSDSANGTSTATPWQHCPGDANATSNPASVTIAAGDVIVFKGGVSYEGTVVVSSARYNDGSNGNLIEFRSGDQHDTPWGAGRAVIEGSCDENGAGGRGKGFYINGRSYIRILGFEIQNMKNETDSSGIFVENASTYCEFQENLIHNIYGASGASGYGIEITGTTTEAHHLIEKNIIYYTEEKGIELYRQGYNTVRYNYIHDTRDHGMVCSSANNEIYNNIFADCGVTWGPYGSAYRAAYGFKFDSGTTVLADSNKFYNNLLWGCSSGIGVLNGDSNTMVHNTVVYTGFCGGESGGKEGAALVLYDDGTAGSNYPDSNIIKNNIFYYSHIIISTYPCTIIYNSTIGNNNEIKNNLIYYDGSHSDLFGYYSGSYSYTNLAGFEGASGFSNVGSGNVASGNVVAAPSFAGGTGATLYGVCPEGFTSDWTPTNDNLGLESDSNAIDAGLALASDYNTDINGVSRPQGSGWDIGAYERADASTGAKVVMILNQIQIMPIFWALFSVWVYAAVRFIDWFISRS